jgi:hypothetical protein
MTEEEIIFDQALETHDAIQTVLDYLHQRKDVEIYVTLIGDLTELLIVLAKDMKGLQDGRKDKGHIQV